MAATAHHLAVADEGPITLFPAPETVLTTPMLDEVGLLQPYLSYPGELVNEKYAGLLFHFIGTPIWVSYVDFRLTEDNRYELLQFDGKNVADAESLEAFVNAIDISDGMFEDDGKDDTQHLVEVPKGAKHSDRDIMTGVPTWAQSHYELSFYDEDDPESPEDPTDYLMKELQDEEGNALEFVGERYAGADLFGGYYLFYSPKTRLVRQFFQCT